MSEKRSGVAGRTVRPAPRRQALVWSWLRSYGIPSLLVFVAFFQMYLVHFEGLNSWRGGGFGMYARFHPNETDLWVTSASTGETIRYAKLDGAQDSRTADVAPYLTFVNEEAVHSYVNSLPDDERADARIEVWELSFDLETLQLTRQRVLDVSGER